MYLEHFKLNKFPFSLTPNIQFFYDLHNHQSVLDMLMICIKNGEGFIKITGEVGTGKTLLCRKLLNQLDDNIQAVYIINSNLDACNIRKAIATELGITFSKKVSQQSLCDLILKKVVNLAEEGKQVVILVDEAQTLPDDSLESLRLLGNLETGSKKLLQIVLFAQPELNKRLSKVKWRQLRQRIVFSHELKPIKKSDLKNYLAYRLNTAGYRKEKLFTYQSNKLLYKHSQGIPRVMNILCHKALILAYGLGKTQVNARIMRCAISDSKEILHHKNKKLQSILIIFVLISLSFSMKNYFLSNFHI